MFKKICLFFLTSAMLAGCTGSPDDGEAPITSFEACVEAGYPVMESYPRQCAVPEGRTFVEIIENTDDKDVDEHGCLVDEGFVWCQEAEQCIREGEECKKDPDAPAPKRSYYLIEQALKEKRGGDLEGKTLGIRSLSLSHFRGRMAEEPDGVILAAKRNNEWVIVHDGTDDFTCAEVEPYYFPKKMISDCRP